MLGTCGNYCFVVVIESIREFNRAVPFVPYEIHAASGENLRDSASRLHLCFAGGFVSVVVDSKDPKDVPHHISALLIERGSLLNGQKRRKLRKR